MLWYGLIIADASAVEWHTYSCCSNLPCILCSNYPAFKVEKHNWPSSYILALMMMLSTLHSAWKRQIYALVSHPFSKRAKYSPHLSSFCIIYELPVCTPFLYFFKTMHLITQLLSAYIFRQGVSNNHVSMFMSPIFYHYSWVSSSSIIRVLTQLLNNPPKEDTWKSSPPAATAILIVN